MATPQTLARDASGRLAIVNGSLQPTRALTVLIDCSLTDGEVITAQPYIVPWATGPIDK